MFAKLAAFALAVPLVAGLTLSTPQDVDSGSLVTFTWTAATTDPSSFSLQLVNTAFHNTFAIANSIPTVNGQLTITIPEVPETGGYTLEAIDNSNVNNVYATSGTFSVGANTSGSTTQAPSTSGTASTPSTTGTATTTPVTTFSTPSVTATIPTSSASGVTTAGTSSAASSTPSNLNSGAASFKLAGVAPAAALVLSAIAGAVMVF